MFWDFSPLFYDVDVLLFEDNLFVQHDMQLFSCDEEYTCRIENLQACVFGACADLVCRIEP